MQTICKFLILFLVVLSGTVDAQKKLLTMEDAITNRSLIPANLQQLSWTGIPGEYVYVSKVNDKEYLVRGSVTNPLKDTLLALDNLNAQIEALGTFKGKMKSFPALKWKNGNMLFTFENTIVVHDPRQHATTLKNRYADKAENTDLDENSYSVAYTIDNNLYVDKGNDPFITDDKPVQITNDADINIVNGKSVHREEFGIFKGTFWSPKGNMLAFYRMDQTMVTDYPLVDISSKPAAENTIKYPMAGMKSHHVTVGVYNLNNGSVIYLNTGEPKDQYLTNITWSPDERYIYIAVLNRGQNHMKLNQYDASNGSFVKTLFEEKDEKYVEPLHGMTFLTKKPEQFLWFSQGDGYQHLYLYDTNGKLIRQVTKGPWVVTDLKGLDEKEESVFIMSTAESALERHLYSVSLKDGAILKLTTENGTHSPIISPDKKYFLDSYTSLSIPRSVDIISTKGKMEKNIFSAPDPLKDYELGEMRLFSIKADDGVTDLNCRMFKPIRFDPSKKYPVVIYVYGGPHAQLVKDSWLGGANLWFQLMAQKGYVVFTVDGRGSEGRGKEFEQAIFRNLGVKEVADQMKGVEYLKSLQYVDANRIGVHGWSYGGFITTSMMLKHPDAFKAGVAGGPVTDWKFYEVMYTERYMDTPEENPEGYKNADLLNSVKNLKNNRLLMIHGTVDNVVVWQHSLNFLKKAVDEGVQMDYFVYPGHPHNVTGKDRVHLMNKVTQYFEDFLK